MLPWGIEVAVNVALVAVALWAARGARARRSLWWLGFAYVSLLVLVSLLGAALAGAALVDPFAAEYGEIGPGLLVRTAATGLTLLLLPALATIILYRRLPDDSRR